jgi:hypothetical protein
MKTFNGVVSLTMAVIAMTISLLLVSKSQVTTKPDYSGVWKLRSEKSSEVWTIVHSEPDIRVVMEVHDYLGKRTIDVKGKVDGEPHHQTVIDTPATLVAKWEDGALVWNLKRETPRGVIHVQRSFIISKEGKTMIADRKLIGGPENRVVEIWDKQDVAGNGNE